MPDFDYDRWWLLHLRVSKGDVLSENEQSEYRLGLRILDGEDEALNRPQLIKYRLAQQLQDLLQGKLRLQEQQIHELQATISAQRRYISALQAWIEGARGADE